MCFNHHVLTIQITTAFEGAQVLTVTSSIVENNVAIIVGSMLAFANFCKVYVAQSSSFRALISRITKRNHEASVLHNTPSTHLRTIGSFQPKVNNYYKISESALLKSQCTTNGELNKQKPGFGEC